MPEGDKEGKSKVEELAVGKLKTQLKKKQKHQLITRASREKRQKHCGQQSVGKSLVSCRTTSRTPAVSLSRAFCKVVRQSKMKLSLYQDEKFR